MIVFQKLRWKNFLSTGNAFTEIDLSKNNSTLIVGHNGAGKSTILEALCFALFGKAFRRINKPNLINSVNGKNCVVEVEFQLAGSRYKIIRGIKPGIFEIYINDKLLDQSARTGDYQEYLEKYIIKMNFKSFTQIVILGAQSFTPFMQLSAADRRAIIEDLLDIQIFSVMNIVAKQKVQQNKEDVERLRYDVRLLEEKKDLVLKTIKSIETKNVNRINELKVELHKHESEKTELENQISLYNQQLESLLEMISDDLVLREKHKKYIGLFAKIEANLSRQKESIEFYNVNDSCPTCHQVIEPEFKSSIIEKSKNTVTELETGLDKLQEQIAKVVADINVVDKLIEDISNVRQELATTKTELSHINLSITRINKQINEVSSDDNLYTTSKDELKVIDKEMKKCQNNLERSLVDRSHYDLILSLLKDGGIKTKIIKKYLPIINKQINKYLAQLDFFVNFTLDENFNESIKSRHRDEFQYANFSNGEKMRIDLAILFTWRTIARMRNSVSTNLLILDEVFDSSMDSSGVDDFIKIINALSSNTNIFIISHKGDVLLDKFEKVIQFEKYQGFSRIVS